MSGNLLMLAFELQLCLIAAATLANLKNEQKAAAVQRDGRRPVAMLDRIRCAAPRQCYSCNSKLTN
jgi:hypothetical protein